MERLFFELLQVAIGNRQCLSAVPKKEEWLLLFQMSTKQALAGIAFHGVQLLPKEQQPERNLILQWYAIAMQIQVANEKTNKATLQARNFFHEQGFRSCVLKGQGNSLLYPVPNIRMSGDIDLWVEGGEQKVLAFVKEQVNRPEMIYHHVEFKDIDGVEVEVHYRPSFMNNLIHNRRLQRWFEEQAKEQFSHEVELPDGGGMICVPTTEFNLIYQMAHICNHVIHEGIGLRQMMDYYYLLLKAKEENRPQTTDNGGLMATLKYLNLYQFAGAVMWVLHKVFGLEEEYYIVPADERRGKFLLDEILIGGNFGQWSDGKRKLEDGRLVKNIQRLKRDFRLMWYFPSECLWEPIFRVYHFFWRLLNSLALRVEGAASRGRKNVKK
ncbi:MAG: nucleotidyltransferase family protein [Bacteroidaceae bacterium]